MKLLIAAVSSRNYRRFFISQYTRPGDLVYDPFSGRGTTAVEAALNNRRVAANDVNPLSAVLTRPAPVAAIADGTN